MADKEGRLDTSLDCNQYRYDYVVPISQGLINSSFEKIHKDPAVNRLVYSAASLGTLDAWLQAPRIMIPDDDSFKTQLYWQTRFQKSKDFSSSLKIPASVGVEELSLDLTNWVITVLVELGTSCVKPVSR